MFIPIHDENPRLHTPVATLAIVAAIILAWFAAQGAGTGYAFARSLCELGLIPGELTARSIGTVVPLGDGLACVVDGDPGWHTVLTFGAEPIEPARSGADRRPRPAGYVPPPASATNSAVGPQSLEPAALHSLRSSGEPLDHLLLEGHGKRLGHIVVEFSPAGSRSAPERFRFERRDNYPGTGGTPLLLRDPS